MLSDRSNRTDKNGKAGSELPEFTDVKIFIDSLLMEYQTNRPIRMEVERTAMACTAFRADYLFSE